MSTDNSSEREAFEAWAATVMLNLKRLYAGYFHEATAFAWLAWQARAALPQQAQETSLPSQGAAEWLQINTKRVAPWTDFAGKPIFAGDTIVHPSGETGVVVFLATESDPGDQWRVLYVGSATLSRLCLQIGDKGQAVVVDRATLAASPAPASLPPQGAASGLKLVPVEITPKITAVIKEVAPRWFAPSVWSALLDAAAAASPPAPQEPARVYLVATGETYEGRETYTRHDTRPPLCDAEALYASPAPGELGAVDASAWTRLPWWQIAKDCGCWTDADDTGLVHFGSTEALRVFVTKITAQAFLAGQEEAMNPIVNKFGHSLRPEVQRFMHGAAKHLAAAPEPPLTQQAPSESSAQGDGGEKA